MESVFRGVAVYLVLLIVVRLSGRRTLAQTTPFDFVLLLIVAETTQQALLGDDFSVTNAAVLIVTLFTMDILLTFLKRRADWLARFIDGVPTVLIAKGEPDWEAMHRARVSLEDVLEAARVGQGLARLDQIDFAVLEVSGGISIVPRGE
ncbi:DUF421 domain-containing protein [Wenxinia marina]|uniref:Putative membrane protein n=1 Tax=Wenxinia marina DSM 24838 TaxID=1123501 RepID=A0A0D0QDK0_9RHOB|nr:YetF domain-containing protein [Wenxinia marina]KIQ70412.1 putative membrane protein [Wenxinia marina DSM 24838]GGL53365.1 DUF421 domain-containing protein [Wenxinia marina]